MIQVINRALDILEFLSQDPEKEFGLTEIAMASNLNAGTCANIIKTLVNRNYVDQPVSKKGYKLGYMSYRLTKSNNYNKKLIDIAKIPMEDLRELINETVILSVINRDQRLVLEESQSTQEIQVRTTKESSVYRATTGRLLLSHFSHKELDDFINRIGLPTEEQWPEIKTKSDLLRELNEISKENVFLTWNKNHVVGLATPILQKNRVIASLGIYLPDIRFGKSEKNQIIKELKKTTDIINVRLDS